jgi:hypothetical protein
LSGTAEVFSDFRLKEALWDESLFSFRKRWKRSNRTMNSYDWKASGNLRTRLRIPAGDCGAAKRLGPEGGADSKQVLGQVNGYAD